MRRSETLRRIVAQHLNRYCKTVGRLNPKRAVCSTVEIATERKTQRYTDFLHPQAMQPRNTLTQPVLRNSDRIVEIYCARRLHAVLRTQDDFGGNPANCGSYGRPLTVDKYEMACRVLAPRRAAFVRQGKSVESYSAGQAASLSQGKVFSTTCGCLEYPARSRSSLVSASNLLRCSRSA
jgi:hypothetical protein